MRRGRRGGLGSGRGSRDGGDEDEGEAPDPHAAKAAAHAGAVDPMDSEVFELKLDGQEPPPAAGDEGEGEDDEEPEESTSAVRRRRGTSGRSSSGRSSGRARRGGGSARDDDRAQVEAEKKKVQTVLMIAIPVGLLFLLVVAVVAGGGESKPQEENEQVEQSGVKVKDVPATVLSQVKTLLEEGTNDYKAATSLEGGAKVAKLQSAARKLSEATDAANAARNRIPESQRGGPNFDQLDGYDQKVSSTRIMVRKALLEAGANAGD